MSSRDTPPAAPPARSRFAAAICLLLLLNLAALGASMLFGTEKVTLAEALGSADGPPEIAARRVEVARHIYVQLRLPRALFGMVVGACLALSGAVFQAVLRNDLATPYTLGVSGGAALGALLAFKAGLAFGYWLQPLAALIGAGACSAIIVALAWAMARSEAPLDTATILLAGVTVNILCGAGVLLTQYLSNPDETFANVRWMMGDLDPAQKWWLPLAVGAPCAPIALGLCLLGRELNALNLGEIAAHSLGVRVGRTQLLGLGGACVLTALCVAFAGPIGFVGLIVPHAARLALGPDNRLALPASALLGAAFLAACDAAARSAFRSPVPVGLATAILGSPFFLWLLFRRAR